MASKGLKLLVKSCEIDRRGAPYLACTDEAEPQVDLRIYYQKANATIEHLVGEVITADIKDICTSQTEVYFKVAASTVKQVEDDVEITVKNHRGKDISAEEFITEYGTCACCTGFVDPMKKHRFTIGGEALCDECLADPQVVASVSLM